MPAAGRTGAGDEGNWRNGGWSRCGVGLIMAGRGLPSGKAVISVDAAAPHRRRELERRHTRLSETMVMAWGKSSASMDAPLRQCNPQHQSRFLFGLR